MFSSVKSLEDLKKQYKDLAKKYHPDLGGTKEDMQRVNAEYERLLKGFKDGEKTGIAYRDFIDSIIHLNVDIELVGTWVWVYGNTYPIKDELKEKGMKWSKARKKWFWAEGIEGSRKRGNGKAFGALRSAYGSEKVKSEKTLGKAL